MKKLNTSLLVALSLLFFSCTKTTEKVTNTTTSVTNPVSTGGTGSGTNTGNTTPSGCDGILRDGATKCYYKNLPTVLLSGPGTYGVTYWSSTSATASGTGLSPNQFVTDATFNVRIIPRKPTGGTSLQGRTCSTFTAGNFSKLKVKLMLRKSGNSLGEVATVSANIDTPSNVWHYTVPGGTTNPYILEVVEVTSDHRCNKYYGTPPANCTYMDIPVVTNTSYPTECVAFDIQYSTDETYDLPGTSAN